MVGSSRTQSRHSFRADHFPLLLSISLAVSFGAVVSVDDDDVGWLLALSGEESLEDVLDTVGVSDLGVDAVEKGKMGCKEAVPSASPTAPNSPGTRNVRGHGIAALLLLALVVHAPPWVVLWRRLGEPDVLLVVGHKAESVA